MSGAGAEAAEIALARDEMMRMVMGFALTPMLYVAAKLGVADRLADGPRDGQQLALDLGADEDALRRLLLALATHGVFARDGEAFRLTPLGELLRTRPGSLRAAVLYWGAPWIWNIWGELLGAVETGRPAFDRVHGVAFFEYLARVHEASSIFNDFMTQTPSQRHDAVAATYAFGVNSIVVDVGGGRGATLAAVLRCNPTLRGILFDRTSADGAGATTFDDPAIAGRCAMVTGDFFTGVPEGGDYYILSSILHDWGDAQALDILRTCRRAMPPGTKLLVIERIIEPCTDHSVTHTLDMCMLGLLGGRERTAAEFARLYAQAGFQIVGVLPTGTPFSIIEGASVSSPSTERFRQAARDRTT